eukprot:CAMPEP_0197466984 /NCGR_PEP_ID=MMETSP1175-20131217/65334_1 /TAXON_ID=1003142 /ORGANISM="Triceratium dubium, Strain CCMP147" /LENGTH=568 /DNA_ID=CAMNT_0043003043 /DNA_START=88 /DNA_END=1791 /DNA_ORIENTATION=+
MATLWAPTAEVPQIRHLPSSAKARPPSDPHPAPCPLRDSARMGALKGLRHKMIALCSSAGRGEGESGGMKVKPPTLAFERWLARAALRREDAAAKNGIGDVHDPVLPSDGTFDVGLARDLARSLPSYEAAKSVAEDMAREGKQAAAKVGKVGRQSQSDDSSESRDVSSLLTQARRKIKDASKAVSSAAKVSRKSLKDFSSNDIDADENTVDVAASLAALRAATRELDSVARDAERIVGCGSSDGQDWDSDKVMISESRRRGIFDVALSDTNGQLKKPYLTVSSSHLIKLLVLWSRQRGNKKTSALESGRSSNPANFIKSLPADERDMFVKALYCLLARYEGLKGAGYQCAVPSIAFDAAKEECGLGTTIECFASPLNCRYSTFCSAFPDTEACFGSMGSFFDDDAFNPVEGSFEANPPFVPETMTAMGQKIESILGDDRAGIRGPLSFLVVVPAWGAGIKFCRDLENSVHCRAAARVAAADHAFADGAQHTKTGANAGKGADLRPSSWDTAVILMQNDAGSARWPVDTARLEGSFCKALCDSTEGVQKDLSTLDAWERRGIARGGSAI